MDSDKKPQKIAADLLASHSFDEILAPIRQGFATSGLNEEAIDSLFAEAREELWQEKQAHIKISGAVGRY